MGNSPIFLMVHSPSSNGQWFKSYDFWKMTGLLEYCFWTDSTSQDKLAFQPKFAMTALQSSNTNLVANLLSFQLVTHMIPSDTQFIQSGLRCWINSGQISNRSETSDLGHKMTEGQRDLNTDFTADSLNFSTLTHTHESGKHRNSYGHPKTAITRSFSGQAGNRFHSNGLETCWCFFALAR
jgi:hypothetical protein